MAETQTETLAQGLNTERGEWETLGWSDPRGDRTAWWAAHTTPGVFSAFRTVSRVTTVTVEEVVLSSVTAPTETPSDQ